MMKKKQQHAPARWWSPPFYSSPDAAVRAAWHEFVAYKRGASYSLTDAILFIERRVPQRAGGSNGSDVYGPLGPGLNRWLRELRT